MKTNIAIAFDDDTRARIRAFYNRSGLATRSEIRRFVLDELEQSVKELPEVAPRHQRPTCNDAAGGCGRLVASVNRDGFCGACQEAKDEAEADLICKHCRQPKADHGRLGFRCPPSLRPAKLRHTKFEPVEEVVCNA